MNLPSDATPLIPPLPTSEPSAPRSPWGFWATVGLSLLAMGVMVGAQAAVAVVFAVVLAAQHQAKHGQPIPTGELMTTLVGNPLMLALAVLVSVPAVLVVLWGMIRLRRGPTLVDYLGLRGFPGRQFFIWGASLAAVVLAGGGLMSWLGDDSGSKFISALLTKGQSIPLLIVALVVGAPLVEEALFRGFMYRGMTTARWAPLGAILIPNVLWALLHVQYRWPTILVLFAMGLVLGAARHFSRSTMLPFTLHLLSNSASVCVAFAMLRSGTSAP